MSAVKLAYEVRTLFPDKDEPLVVRYDTRGAAFEMYNLFSRHAKHGLILWSEIHEITVSEESFMMERTG